MCGFASTNDQQETKTMMPTTLHERFEQLLGFAKDPAHNLVARENLAAAKEMVDTLLVTGHLDQIEYRAYRSMCTTAGIIISTAELQRASAVA